MEPELVAPREVLDLPGHDGAVRDAHDRALVRAHARRPQGDVLDLAELASDPAGVADRQRLVGEHREAREDVLQALLGGEGEHEPADAEAGQRGRHVDPEDRQREDHDEDEGGRPKRTPPERQRRARRGAAGRHDPAQEEAVHDVHDAQEEPEKGEEQEDVEQAVVVDAVQDRDAEPEDGDPVKQQRQQESPGAARRRGPLPRDLPAAQEPREGERRSQKEPRHAEENGKKQDEGEDLPERQRSQVRPHEEFWQPSLDLWQQQLPVEPPRLADRLPGEEPDRGCAWCLPAHEENVEPPFAAEELADALDLRGKPVVHRTPRRPADALEARRNEAMVEHGLELPGDLLALGLERGRDLQVFRGGRVAARLDGAQESEEAPVGRLPPVGVGRLLLRRRRRRRRGGHPELRCCGRGGREGEDREQEQAPPDDIRRIARSARQRREVVDFGHGGGSLADGSQNARNAAAEQPLGRGGNPP